MIDVQYNDGRCQILRDGVELCDLSIDDALTVKETLIRDGDKPVAETPSQQTDECELVTVSGVTAIILATMPNGCAAGYLKECSMPTGWTEEGKEISGRSSYDLPAPPVPAPPCAPPRKCKNCAEDIFDNGTVYVHKRSEFRNGKFFIIETQWCDDNSKDRMAEAAPSVPPGEEQKS